MELGLTHHVKELIINGQRLVVAGCVLGVFIVGKTLYWASYGY